MLPKIGFTLLDRQKPLSNVVKLGLFGFVLGLFFVEIVVFGLKTHKIGFVLHKKVGFVEEALQM
jgi:hypothetical protein